MLISIFTIVIGLVGRAVVDKFIALDGGPDLLASWAQLQSVMELVSGVAVAGIAPGLSVLVAQSPESEVRKNLLLSAIAIGLALGFPVLVIVVGFEWLIREFSAPQWLANWLLPAEWAVAAVTGWLTIGMGMLNAYLIGARRRYSIFWLAAFTAAASAGVAAFASERNVILPVLVFQAAMGALVIGWFARQLQRPGSPVAFVRWRELGIFIWPSLAIGICSPLSYIIIRNCIADGLSPRDVGLIHSLWRASDWVTVIAGGVLSLYWLPRMAGASDWTDFRRLLRQAFQKVVVPSALALAVLCVLLSPALKLLFTASFELSIEVSALILAGDAVRVFAWLMLYALYACKATRWIAIGEILSLPLFAAGLFWLGEAMTPARIGMLWLLTYAIYAGFNAYAVARVMRSDGPFRAKL